MRRLDERQAVVFTDTCAYTYAYLAYAIPHFRKDTIWRYMNHYAAPFRVLYRSTTQSHKTLHHYHAVVVVAIA
jgi:hypothetical protein